MIASDNFIPLGKIEGGYIVKVFGKKTMALVMAVAMMLSLCCVNVNAATVTSIALTAKDGKTTIGVGETVQLEVAYTPEGSKTSITWGVDSEDKAIASVKSGKVTGKAPGTATINADPAKSGVENATIEITVEAITAVEVADVFVGCGISASTIKKILNTQELTVKYDGGSYTGACDPKWDWECESYDAEDAVVGEKYTFVLDETAFKDEDGDAIEVEVDVYMSKIDLVDEADATLDTIYVAKGTSVSKLSLPSTVSLLLNNKSTEQDLTVGTKNSNHFEKWACADTEGMSKFETEATYEYTTTLRAKDDWETITLIQPVKIYNNEVTDIDFDAEDSYIFMDDAAEDIEDALQAIFGSDAELKGIKISKITGEKEDVEKPNTKYVSGTLYTDGDCETKVSAGDDTYTAEAFGDMCFVANGKGHDTILEYSAFADEAGKKAVKGRIVIESDTFMILELEVNNSDNLDFSSSAFSSAFKALDSDNTLVYVEFENELSSSEGELYYKYGSSKYEETVYNEEYYVKADADEDEWDLDDVTFVPDEDAKGMVKIAFTAYGYYDGDKDDEIEAAGVIFINILDEADIVITAGIEEKVPVDLELFEEYLDDEVDTTKIAYIVFDGAPYTTSSGYLVSGTKSFKSSGDKTFHMDPDKDEYDLEDLYFVGGDSKTSKRADFEIYYYDGKTVEDDPVTGSVEFVTDISTNVYTKDPLDAAQVLKFSSSISAFEKVGGQENEYFEFTSLPKDAKLYYNYGMSTQADVKTGEAYYLGSVSGSKKALKNITFVPSYSSSKIQQVITFEYKAYDEDDNAVSGACFFEVKYASKSAYFTDITTKTYADSVDFLKNQGITTGTTATTFGPNNNVTRGQFVTFLWRAAGSPTVTGVTNKFTDVKSTGDYAYAYQAILWAVKNNITTGRSATIFDPAANVTHQELLTFLYRYDVNYLKHSGAASTSVSYADFNSVADYAKTAVKWADNKGILDGNTIQPTNAGIRATVALWMHRMLTL